MEFFAPCEGVRCRGEGGDEGRQCHVLYTPMSYAATLTQTTIAHMGACQVEFGEHTGSARGAGDVVAAGVDVDHGAGDRDPPDEPWQQQLLHSCSVGAAAAPDRPPGRLAFPHRHTHTTGRARRWCRSTRWLCDRGQSPLSGTLVRQAAEQAEANAADECVRPSDFARSPQRCTTILRPTLHGNVYRIKRAL